MSHFTKNKPIPSLRFRAHLRLQCLITNVMATQMFTGYKMYKVLASDDEGTISYAIQYSARSLDDVDLYLEKFAPSLREDVKKKFGDHQASFRTLLQEV